MERLPRGFNHHHLFWERRKYSPGFEKKWRNLGGLVIPLPSRIHADLHREIEPPPKPTRNQMWDIRDLLSEITDHTELWGAVAVADYFADQAVELTDYYRAEQALKLGQHLNDQISFVVQQRLAA